jgi:hypothetical protein
MRPGWWQNREAILRCRCSARQPVGDKDVHSALRAVPGGRVRNFVRTKLRPPGYEHIIAKGNYVRCLVLKLPPRKGLQRKARRKAHRRFPRTWSGKPGFWAALAAQKCAHIFIPS